MSQTPSSAGPGIGGVNGSAFAAETTSLPYIPICVHCTSHGASTGCPLTFTSTGVRASRQRRPLLVERLLLGG